MSEQKIMRGTVSLPTACVKENVHSISAAIDAAMTLDNEHEA